MPRSRRVLNQINVVPYIDVMLVLLVIFMVVAPIMQPTVVDLPSVHNANKPIDDKPLRIDVKGHGKYTLTVDNQEIDGNLSYLISQITQKLHSDPKRPVVIAADKSIAYEQVMEAMSRLKQAQVMRVGLLVQQA